MFILDILSEQQLNSWSRGGGRGRASAAVDKSADTEGGGGACSSQHARLQAPGSVRSPQTRTAPTLMRQSLSGTCGSSAWQLCSSSSAPQVTDTRAYTGTKHHFGGGFLCVCVFFFLAYSLLLFVEPRKGAARISGDAPIFLWSSAGF